MEALALNDLSSRWAPPPAHIGIYDDPLDEDATSDLKVVTSTRGLTRLAVVASETGARFQREENGLDPMAWLLAPRELFNGANALQACLNRDDCLRAILLHGLAIGFDASPAMIDALLADDADGEAPNDWNHPWEGGGRPEGASAPGRRRLRLYSAVIVIARGGELLHLFHASVAPAAAVVRDRIRARFGSAAAAQAEIRLGVDLSCPSTTAMMPPAFREMIERGRRIRWSTMSSLDVTVEHRIPC